MGPLVAALSREETGAGNTCTYRVRSFVGSCALAGSGKRVSHVQSMSLYSRKQTFGATVGVPLCQERTFGLASKF
jgi:uncharacterized protein YfiM (DUF2279 family)